MIFLSPEEYASKFHIEWSNESPRKDRTDEWREAYTRRLNRLRAAFGECPGCDDGDCQECCMHDESDHFICMDCGKELDPGSFIDNAMDAFEE